MADGRPRHEPVLAEEAVAWLDPGRGGRFVDCTVGLGGHAAVLLARFPAVRLVGIDRDPAALAEAARRLAPFGDRVELVAGRFGELEALLAARGIERLGGVLADLGVSALQLETAERGFSFRREGPLDMRMGPAGVSAAEIVNGYPEETLTSIFREHGEERRARRIARAIVERRRVKPFATTRELAEVLEALAAAPRGRRPRIHPATRVFQALRIEVNRELDELKALLDQAVRMLEAEGRLVVISYHSLEDRIVKSTLRELALGEIEPVTGRSRAETQVIEVLTRRPVRPSAAEVAANPRARSARLRAARRLGG